MKIKPTANNILLEVEEQKTTKSGIILTGEAERMEKAKVLAVGPEVVDIEVGDIVFFKDFATDDIELDGKKVTFLKEGDVLALEK